MSSAALESLLKRDRYIVLLALFLLSPKFSFVNGARS